MTCLSLTLGADDTIQYDSYLTSLHSKATLFTTWPGCSPTLQYAETQEVSFWFFQNELPAGTEHDFCPFETWWMFNTMMPFGLTTQSGAGNKWCLQNLLWKMSQQEKGWKLLGSLRFFVYISVNQSQCLHLLHSHMSWVKKVLLRLGRGRRRRAVWPALALISWVVKGLMRR